MKRSSLKDRHCSLARAGAALVDGWTLVILREIMLSNRRFDGLQEQTGMSPRSLTMRLATLCEEDILEKISYQERPERFEYQLTEKGMALWPVIVTLKDWSEKYCGPWAEDALPMTLTHAGHDHVLEPKVVCKTCDEPVDVFSGIPEMSAPMIREREVMRRAHRSNRS